MTAVAKTNAGNPIMNGAITIKYYTDEDCSKGETDTAPTNAGVYYAKATLASTDNYAEQSAVAKIDISKVVLTATYISETIRSGATPALKVEVKGFVNDETTESAAGYVAPTVSNSNTAVGQYTLTPAGGSADNYDFGYVSGTLTILSRSSGGSSSSSTPTNTVSASTASNGKVSLDKRTAKSAIRLP